MIGCEKDTCSYIFSVFHSFLGLGEVEEAVRSFLLTGLISDLFPCRQFDNVRIGHWKESRKLYRFI